jgi:electron transport complex protein RnfG
MKDSVKMVAALVIFATVACVGLAFVYAGTKPAIDSNDAKALAAAQKQLFPKAAKFVEIKGMQSKNPAVIFDTDTDKAGIVTKAYQWNVQDSSGKTIGCLIRDRTGGFQDFVVILVGIKTDGSLAGIKITQDNDTPGLGLNAASPTYYVGDKSKKTTFYGQFANFKATDNIKVKKDGGIVDQLTGATITSRAVSLAVQEAVTEGWAWLKANGGAQ